MTTAKQSTGTATDRPFTPFGDGPGIRPADMRKALQDDGLPGFRVMDFELEKLAQWWAETDLNTDLFCFQNHRDPDDFVDSHTLAQRRLQWISEFIGRERTESIIAEVEQSKRSEMGEAAWEVFRNKDHAKRHTFDQKGAATSKDSSAGSHAADSKAT